MIEPATSVLPVEPLMAWLVVQPTRSRRQKSVLVSGCFAKPWEITTRAERAIDAASWGASLVVLAVTRRSTCDKDYAPFVDCCRNHLATVVANRDWAFDRVSVRSVADSTKRLATVAVPEGSISEEVHVKSVEGLANPLDSSWCSLLPPLN